MYIQNVDIVPVHTAGTTVSSEPAGATGESGLFLTLLQSLQNGVTVIRPIEPQGLVGQALQNGPFLLDGETLHAIHLEDVHSLVPPQDGEPPSDGAQSASGIVIPPTATVAAQQSGEEGALPPSALLESRVGPPGPVDPAGSLDGVRQGTSRPDQAAYPEAVGPVIRNESAPSATTVELIAARTTNQRIVEEGVPPGSRLALVGEILRDVAAVDALRVGPGVAPSVHGERPVEPRQPSPSGTGPSLTAALLVSESLVSTLAGRASSGETGSSDTGGQHPAPGASLADNVRRALVSEERPAFRLDTSPVLVHVTVPTPSDTVQGQSPGQLSATGHALGLTSVETAPPRSPENLLGPQPPPSEGLPNAARPTLETVGDYTIRSVRYLAGRGEESLTVRLVPESLGELRIVVRTIDDLMEIRLTTGSAAAREMLEHQLPALREALTRDGVDGSRITVITTAMPDTSASTGSFARQMAHQGQPGRSPHPGGHLVQSGNPDGSMFTDAGPRRHEGSLNIFV